MPVCEKCQTPYDDWQHFCLNCGSYVKEGPPPLLRPKCGTGMESELAFEAGASAKPEKAWAFPEPDEVWASPERDEAWPTPEPEAPDDLPAGRSWKWLGGAAAALLALVAILIWHFHQGAGQQPAQVAESTVAHPEAAQKKIAEGGTEATRAPAAEARLETEVAALLANIREANLKKNILLFMGTLSGVYPQLDKKREEVLRTWKKFNFKDMAYTIGKVQEVEPNKAVAEVKWTTTSQNLATKAWRTTEFQYRISLANELGQWKITKIEQIPQ